MDGHGRVASPATPPPGITVYCSSVSGSLAIKRHQQHVLDTLCALRIPHAAVDVASPEGAGARDALRAGSPAGGVVLPQIHVGGAFRMDYGAFVDALEGGTLREEVLRPATPRLGEDTPASFVSR